MSNYTRRPQQRYIGKGKLFSCPYWEKDCWAMCHVSQPLYSLQLTSCPQEERTKGNRYKAFISLLVFVFQAQNTSISRDLSKFKQEWDFFSCPTVVCPSIPDTNTTMICVHICLISEYAYSRLNSSP